MRTLRETLLNLCEVKINNGKYCIHTSLGLGISNIGKNHENRSRCLVVTVIETGHILSLIFLLYT